MRLDFHNGTSYNMPGRSEHKQILLLFLVIVIVMVHYFVLSRRIKFTVKLHTRTIYWYVSMVITYSKSKDQPGKVANYSFSAEQEKLIFPCPRLRQRISSRETGSAVPSRVSLLISILRLNLVLTYGIPPDFHDGVHL